MFHLYNVDGDIFLINSREKLDELEKSSENSPLRQDSIAEEDEGCPAMATEGSSDANEHFKKREAS